MLSVDFHLATRETEKQPLEIRVRALTGLRSRLLQLAMGNVDITLFVNDDQLRRIADAIGAYLGEQKNANAPRIAENGLSEAESGNETAPNSGEETTS
jgi:pyocin large subunit-like protein